MALPRKDTFSIIRPHALIHALLSPAQFLDEFKKTDMPHELYAYALMDKNLADEVVRFPLPRPPRAAHGAGV